MWFPLVQILPEIGPGLGGWSKALRHGSNVQKNRFHPLHNSEARQSNRIDAIRTQQLRRRPKERGIIWVISQAQRHANFLVAELLIIIRQIRPKITRVMIRSTQHSALQQPFTNAFLQAAADVYCLSQKRGHVGDVTQFIGQRRGSQLFCRRHIKIISWFCALAFSTVAACERRSVTLLSRHSSGAGRF